MRTVAIEYPARGQVHLADIGMPPEPEPGQMLLETIYSGITNGTERHALLQEHGYGTFPGRHGYQQVCRVAAVGEGVGDDRVGQVWFYGEYVGHRGWNCITPYQGCLLIPIGDLEPSWAALFGVAGVGHRAVRRMRIGLGSRVWVAGQGLIGAFAAQAARAAGAYVVVSDVDGDRLAVASDLGAHEALDARDEVFGRRLRSLGAFTHVIDACGVPDLLHQVHGYGLLAMNAAIGLIAVRGEVSFPWAMLHGIEASIEVSCHYPLADLWSLLHLVRTGVIRVDPLVSHRVGIDEAPGIYETLRDRPGDLRGVVFDWS